MMMFEPAGVCLVTPTQKETLAVARWVAAFEGCWLGGIGGGLDPDEHATAARVIASAVAGRVALRMITSGLSRSSKPDRRVRGGV